MTSKSSGGLWPPQQPIMPIYSLCSTWCCGGRRPPLLFLLRLLRLVIVLRPPPDWIASAVRLDSVRRPIRLRPPSNRIPSAVRSDCVRRPIGLRPPSDQIPFAVRLDCVRVTMTFREGIAARIKTAKDASRSSMCSKTMRKADRRHELLLYIIGGMKFFR